MSVEDKEAGTPPPTDMLMSQGPTDNRNASAKREAAQESSATGGVSNARKSRVPKIKEKVAGTGDTTQQMNAPDKPGRTTRTGVKVAGVAEPPEVEPSVPKRTRRRASPGKDVNQDMARPVLHRGDIPPVTEEAIEFLANSDARVPDLFKLQPQSREFVLYHVSNMQRLDADIASGRSYLAAHMPKFSPELEKTADALIAKLAQSGRATSTTITPHAEKSISTSAPRFYGPNQATEVVQVRAPNPVAAGAQNRESEVENIIERSPVLELDKQPTIDVSKPGAVALAESKSLPGFGKKVLGIMGSTADVASAWLHSKAKQAETSRVAGPSLGASKEPTPPDDTQRAVPTSVTRRFLKVETEYYFPDKTPAFSDRGAKLATRGAHPEVVRSLVEIAQARGWTNITVKGAEEFRRSAWMEAAQVGLKVTGYQPTALELAELANRPAKNTVEKGPQRDLDKMPATRPIPDTSADRPSAGQHDQVGTTPKGVSALKAELIAKASAFEKDKPSFVLKNHPELAPAYGVVDMARKFAEAHLPEDAREEFVGLARRHVIQKIVTGESVKGPKIYVEHAKSRKATDQTSSVGKETNEDKAQRTKDVVRER